MSLEGMQSTETLHHQVDETYMAETSLPASGDRVESPDNDGGWAVPPATTPVNWLQRWNNRWWMVLAGTIVLSLLAGGGLAYSFEQTFADRIYPNVSIRGVPVGRMTRQEAQAALQQRYADFLQQPVRLTYGDQTWTPSLAELGIEPAMDTAVQQAIATGRQHSWIGNLGEIAVIWQEGREIPLRLTVDTGSLQQYVVARAAEIEQPASDARLELQAGAPVAVPAIAGRQVLIEETMQDMVAALQSLEPQVVVVRTRELLPRVADADISALQRQVDRLLSAPLKLRARGETWQWSPYELSQFIQISRPADADATNDEVVIQLDRQQIRQRLEELADATAYGGTRPRIDWNGGALQIIEAGEPGYRINVDRAEQKVVDAIYAADSRPVTLPFRKSQVTVSADNLAQLGITELVAIGRSDFSGSAAYRITNIQAGMALLNGLLLAPGEEFSFNQAIGSIDASNGFVEGYAIIQNRTQLEWGGGICQDSTTLFRAAFWAGLPITERWGHSFYISWYDAYGYGAYGDGPGIDATIFTGGPDLKFVNDTGHWLLIQTYVDVDTALAEVRLYGTRGNRTVEFGGAEIFNRTAAPTQPQYVPNPALPRGARYQSDTARGGMSIAFTRIIKEDGVETKRERFVTEFRPWPNIYEVNPADMPGGGPPVQVAAPPTQGTATPATTPAATADPAATAEPGEGAPPPEVPIEPTPAPPAAPPPDVPTEPPPEVPTEPPPAPPVEPPPDVPTAPPPAPPVEPPPDVPVAVPSS